MGALDVGVAHLGQGLVPVVEAAAGLDFVLQHVVLRDGVAGGHRATGLDNGLPLLLVVFVVPGVGRVAQRPQAGVGRAGGGLRPSTFKLRCRSCEGVTKGTARGR